MEKGWRGDIDKIDGFVGEQIIQTAVGDDIRHV